MKIIELTKYLLGMYKEHFFVYKRINQDSEIAKNGYEIINNFMPMKDCNQIIEYFKPLEKEKSYYLDSETYYIRRSELNMGKYKLYDLNTRQFFNIQNHIPIIKKIIENKLIEKLFYEKLNINLYVETVSLQINDADLENRQPLHVDAYTPTNFKFFIYLSDCSHPYNGPYTYVRGSHLHNFRKSRSLLKNFVKKNHLPQMELEYSSAEADLILGKAGDGIMSSMSGVHAGYKHHTKSTRYMLVFQLSRDKIKKNYIHAAETIQ